MKYIGALLVVLGLVCVVLGAPTFGTYSCGNAQYPITDTGVVVGNGRYGLAARVPPGAYEIKQSFNFTGTILGNSYTPYFTVYTGQSYVILDLNANTTTVAATSPNLTTCAQTLTSFADEATRVVNIARAASQNGVIYRNTFLDQAAATLIATQTLSINQAYSNSTAAGSTTATFQAGTGALVNPGSTVQSLITSTVANTARTAREIGAYYNTTAGVLAYVFSSRAVACGNGLVDGTETCDDGNTVSGDGCSSTCQTEGGYNCTQNYLAATSVCTRQANVSPSTTPSASVAPSSGTVSPTSRASVSSSTLGTVSPTSVASASSSTGSSATASTTRSAALLSSGSGSISASGARPISGSTTSTASATSSPAGSTAIPSLTSAMSMSESSSHSSLPFASSTTGSASSLQTWLKMMF
eukprot:TRINITY_DN3913_c0_g1_i1.p1 TRINITY_DN3913_c0_g1~~TRINITY_DN3913_c0_g1_i1.p1  ORF type:complete len:414 (-),score=139.67 TRINITY_DN3913_c0_g1_i1:71-1312(-)